MIKKLFRKLLGVLVLLATIAGLYCYSWMNQPMALPEQGLVYQLKAGESLGRVAYDLERQGHLLHPKILLLYARASSQTAVRLGEYQIPAQTTPLQLLQRLVDGKVISYQVTLVEGWTYQQALAHLHSQPKLQKKLNKNDWLQNKQVLGVGVDQPEGWFFPDTYQFDAGSSDADVLLRAHEAMSNLLNTEWAKRASDLPYANAYEALIMASIVERETGAPFERNQIAGVFVRRLNTGMRLQTDPTVIYGMGDSYKGNIRRSDLLNPTPYNTYRISGLPPTPIALPGREAVQAALNPDSGQALYFVAKGDGTHQFSTSLDEHNKAVREHQFRRRSDYRSSPALPADDAQKATGHEASSL